MGTDGCVKVRETLKSKPFDENGDIAKSGEIAPQILNAILEMDYFKLTPPKSTGRGSNIIYISPPFNLKIMSHFLAPIRVREFGLGKSVIENSNNKCWSLKMAVNFFQKNYWTRF